MLTTRKRNIFFLVLAAVLIVADQAAKYLVYSRGFGGFLSRLRPIFSLMIFPNYNFAFSLKVPLLAIYLIYIVLLGLLLFWFLRLPNRSFRLWLGLILIIAGAFSNILDRIYLGYVRDFIYVFWGNIFNLADLYIVAGIILLAI